MEFDFQNSFRDMPLGEPFICSFSGGKDSVLALCVAMDKGEARGLITWYDSEKQESVFHHQNMEILQKQADCIGIPLSVSRYTPWSHRVELIEQYKEFAANGVKSIIFGDIYLEDSAKMQTILCKKAGLVPRFPLWWRTVDDLFDELENREIRTIISRVNTAYLDDEWLGKEYNRETFDTFKKMKIDPFGEKGEFHTTVVDAKIFSQPIEVTIDTEQGTKILYSAHELENNIYRLIPKEFS